MNHPPLQEPPEYYRPLIPNGCRRAPWHNYTPKGLLHTLCSEGRLLIIAPTEHRTASMALDRATCLQMNALAETIAAYSLRRL